MATTITVPPGYGYVLLIALGITPVMAMAHGTLVGIKRKAANIPYPNCYASAQEMKVSKEAYQFNCAQRAHAQFMENAPQFMLSMVVGGLAYPWAATALGLGWVFFRVLYGAGYIYGTEAAGKNRLWGGGFWVCQAGVWGLVISQSLSFL